MTSTVRRAPDNLDVAIGAAIRLRRRHLKISQERLAEQSGVTFQQIQKYENGANRVSFSRLVQIAHALGLRVADLVGDIDEAAGFSRGDARLLEVMGLPGALDLLKDFAQLPPAARSTLRDLVKAIASAGEVQPVKRGP